MAPYNAAELDARLHLALPAPALRLIFCGPPGAGKTVVLASVPVPEGKQRLYLDMEDSAAYVDAGPVSQDVYLPRKPRFHMERMVFPTLSEIAEAYERIANPAGYVGALIIDNISLLQDQIADLLQSGNARQIRNLFARFDVDHYLPVDGIINKWANQRDPSFWSALKLIPRQLILGTAKNQIHFVASTEEGNLWKNYGKSNAEVIGKKANALKTWMQYTDAVIFLKRDGNNAKAPMGEISLLQPKIRMQGMNPSWVMDWPGFIAELEAASKRGEEPIATATQVSQDVISEEPGTDDLPAPAAAPTATTAKPPKGEDYTTKFWLYVKAHPEIDGQAVLEKHDHNFAEAYASLGVATK